ncbi:MAG: hypothetical protein KAT00_06645, partial [Planctomycetes bacterium]|nr:hypothetical protein [Planctomycetota bacterium]
AKTLLLVFKTSGDITSKQNIWEQGGYKAGGLNFYLEDGSLYINGWTLKLDDGFTDWGPTALNAGVSTDTVYVATLVMDSVGGTFEGFINGISIGIDSTIDLLPKHQNDCAFGHTEGVSRFHSGGHGDDADFTGMIAEFYSFNAVLSVADRQMLETVLMEKYGIE